MQKLFLKEKKTKARDTAPEIVDCCDWLLSQELSTQFNYIKELINQIYCSQFYSVPECVCVCIHVHLPVDAALHIHCHCVNPCLYSQQKMQFGSSFSRRSSQTRQKKHRSRQRQRAASTQGYQNEAASFSLEKGKQGRIRQVSMKWQVAWKSNRKMSSLVSPSAKNGD